MPSFKDKTEREWNVQLDAPLVEEVEEKHGILLTNLENDPLVMLRNDPMKLVAVIYILCQEKIEELGLTPKQFAKQLPSPSDPMLHAIRDAIVDFFPAGHASSVREVLTELENVEAKTTEVLIREMKENSFTPEIAQRLTTKAKNLRKKLLEENFPLDS